MKLNSAQRDRACGVLLATAAGDALGAPFEFGPPLAATTVVAMTGGGGFGWAPGEWTDDTSMAVAIAEVAATGADLREPCGPGRRSWPAGSAGRRAAKDVGIQTRSVLSQRVGREPKPQQPPGSYLHQRTGRSGGNGSLMRTAPVALAYLDDPDALSDAARTISALTHYDPGGG